MAEDLGGMNHAEGAPGGDPVSPPPAAFDTFISYSSADRSVALQLHDALTSKGLSVWIDRAEIAGGRCFSEEIAKGIADSSTLLLLISATSVQSDEVFREVALANKLRRELVLIDLDGMIALPRRLDHQLAGRSRQSIPRAKIEEGADSIAANIRTLLDGQRRAFALPWSKEVWVARWKYRAIGAITLVAAGAVVVAFQSLRETISVGNVESVRFTQAENLVDLRMIDARRAASRPQGQKDEWDLRFQMTLLVSTPSALDVDLVLIYRAGLEEPFRTQTLALEPLQTAEGRIFKTTVSAMPKDVLGCVKFRHPKFGELWRVTVRSTGELKRDGGEAEQIQFVSRSAVATKDEGQTCQ